MAQMQVFVSHSHKDDAFCRAIVAGLRNAGADVWYDEHNMGSGRLGPTIEHELRRRPVFVVVLSLDALTSEWVEDETRWAYNLYRRDRTRIMLPVTARAINEDNIWLFLQDFKRIEAAGQQPYSTEEAVRRLLHALALTPAGEAPAPTAPRPSESVADLVERGKALQAQERYAEALPLFERASQLHPRSYIAWANLSSVLFDLRRYEEALTACDRALRLDSKRPWVWNLKGDALHGLKRYVEALAAYDRALTLDPDDFNAWAFKGFTLRAITRHDEALVAFDQALTLDPGSHPVWASKGLTLCQLKRYDEALVACDQALTLDPNYANAWTYKGVALHGLRRYEEALAAHDQALALSETRGRWRAKARTLRALGRTDEAEAAERRAKELDR